MKKSINTLYLASGLLMAGAGVQAIAQDMHAKTHDTVEETRGTAKDPVAGTQKRLADLKQKLNLKSTQQAAWDTFSNALIAQAKAQTQSKEKMKATIGHGFESKPTPEKMEIMAAMMRTSADNLSKTAADTKTFYEVLSPEQKTIFDLFAKDAWNNRMRQHMHHGMY